MKLPFETRYLKALAYFVPALLLAFTIGTEIEWGSRVSLPLPQPKPQTPRSAPAPLQPEFSLPPLEQNYTDMLLQPLFVPTRRPSPPAQIEPPKPAMRKGQFTLAGSILTDKKNVALLREIATNKMLRVEQGREINGIQLEKVGKRTVTLKQGDDREELIMKIQPMQKPQPQQMPNPAPASMPSAPAQSSSAPPMMPPINPQADPQGLIAGRRAAHGIAP